MFNLMTKVYELSKMPCLNLNCCVMFVIIIINNNVHVIIYRHLAEEIRGEYSDRSDKGEGADDLVALAKEIIPYNMQHNAETEACDLLMEIEQLELLRQYVDKNSFQRVCLYLTRSVALNFLIVLEKDYLGL